MKLAKAATWCATGAVCVASWWLLAGGASATTPQHGHGGFGANLGYWYLMMMAMMLPAAAPWLATFGEVAGEAFPGRRHAPLLVQFVAGYFVVWLGYSAGGAAMQQGLSNSGLLAVDLRVGATLGGTLLLVAAAFQLTPLKDACLRHCRNPLSFFLTRWDGRRSGPFRMGARHGLWCVGCCWALMALAFVLGVMNLLWMAALTAIIVAEQWLPRRALVRRASGVALATWGLALILS